MALIKRRYVFEADDDEGSTSGSTPSDPTVTSTDSQSDNNSTDDASSDDNDTSTNNSNDDSNSEDENSDDQNQNNDDEDYSIDAEPDADDSGDDSSSSNDNSSDDSSDNTDDSGSEDNSEEKELDRQMFDTLSEEEKKRKIATLKKNFIDLHAKCGVLIEKFNQIEDESNDDLDSIVKRILTILYDMKEYVSYYILNVFDKSSYIENDVMINRYISVLNGIKLTVDQLQKEKEKGEIL